MNKTEVKKLLVEERKSMRAKAKQSEFMRKTLSIYGGQVKRAAEAGTKIPYTLAELRDFVDCALIAGSCPYGGGVLTLKNMAVDHETPIARGGEWELTNLRICTKATNWQKGIMTGFEFTQLMHHARVLLDPAAFDDLKRRLTTGGKWLAKRF